jgi:hypothetical protein
MPLPVGVVKHPVNGQTFVKAAQPSLCELAQPRVQRVNAPR